MLAIYMTHVRWREPMADRPLIPLQIILVAFIFASSVPGWADEHRGKALYRLCIACHGQQGEGRLDLGAPAIAGLPEWYVSAQLLKFRNGIRGTHPQDIAGMRMRPMARTLPSEDDVKAMARYVGNLPPQAPSPTLTGNPADGASRYAVCMACHGPDGKGNQQMGAPPLVTASDWYLLTQLKNFKHGVRGGNPATDVTGAMMMPMATPLDEQAMKDVIAYIQTLR
jgi:cytochrome c553